MTTFNQRLRLTQLASDRANARDRDVRYGKIRRRASSDLTGTRYLNYPLSQRGRQLVCTDCASLSIISKRCNTRAYRPPHFRGHTTRCTRRRRTYGDRSTRSRPGRRTNATAELLFYLASLVTVAMLVRDL